MFGPRNPPKTKRCRPGEAPRRPCSTRTSTGINATASTDGYSTYGGRAWLKFVGGQTNYEVVQRELEILDVMTANRDKVIWAVAQGKDAKPDDSNLPPFVPVTTNKPGTGPNGTHLFLSRRRSDQEA